MKTLTSHKYITAIIAIAVFALVFNGCKKADLKAPTTISTDDATAIAKIKADVAKQMKAEGGIPQIFVRNQKVTTQWVDQFRNPVTVQQMQATNFTSVCNYDLPAYCNLIQYSRVFQCAGSGLGGPGYLLQFEFEVSWNNNIINKNTLGNIEIYDPSNTYVSAITLDAASEVFIEDAGADPVNSGNEIFRVKFVSVDYTNDLIAAYMVNGDFGTYTFKLSAQFGTDCSSGGSPYSLWALPTTTYGFSNASANDPCERNEKAWYGVGGSGSYANRISITGYDAASPSACSGSYGSPFVRPDLQEVQYSTDGGATFSDFRNDITVANTLDIYNSKFIRKDDIARSAALSGTYNVVIRYKNWKYIGTTNTNWEIPIRANDCFSIGNPASQAGSPPFENDSNYAYEFLGPITF